MAVELDILHGGWLTDNKHAERFVAVETYQVGEGERVTNIVQIPITTKSAQGIAMGLSESSGNQ